MLPCSAPERLDVEVFVFVSNWKQGVVDGEEVDLLDAKMVSVKTVYDILPVQSLPGAMLPECGHEVLGIVSCRYRQKQHH